MHFCFKLRKDALEFVLIHQCCQLATTPCIKHRFQIVPDALETPGLRVRNKERVEPEFLTYTLVVKHIVIMRFVLQTVEAKAFNQAGFPGSRKYMKRDANVRCGGRRASTANVIAPA